MSVSKKIIALVAVVYVMTVIQFFGRKGISDRYNANPVFYNMNTLLHEMLAGAVPGAYAARAVTAMLR